jgi:hypothetical protein
LPARATQRYVKELGEGYRKPSPTTTHHAKH